MPKNEKYKMIISSQYKLPTKVCLNSQCNEAELHRPTSNELSCEVQKEIRILDPITSNELDEKFDEGEEFFLEAQPHIPLTNFIRSFLPGE